MIRILGAPLLLMVAVTAQATGQGYDSGYDQEGNPVVTDGSTPQVGESISVWTDDGWEERYVESIDGRDGNSIEVELEDSQDRLFLY